MIPTSLTKIAGPVGLKLQRYAPEILTVVGLASMTAGALMAVKATTKLERTLHDAEARIADVKADIELADNVDVEHIYNSPQEMKKALYGAYLRNVLEFTKLYGPAVSVFIAGGVSIAVGHGILAKRNVALVAAYNAVEKSFAAYRARVIEDLGEDKDRDYRYGITETTETVDGKKVVTSSVDPNHMSMYARCFDESNENWQKEPGYNQFFLTTEQNRFNDLLIRNGYVFLNDVYARLGFNKVPEGQVVGWLLKPGHDNFIDFDIFDLSDQKKRQFINGDERSIFLDFNVDGTIFDKIDKVHHKSDPRRFLGS
jgi:Family of unknown function (DUF6353)